MFPFWGEFLGHLHRKALLEHNPANRVMLSLYTESINFFFNGLDSKSFRVVGQRGFLATVQLCSCRAKEATKNKWMNGYGYVPIGHYLQNTCGWEARFGLGVGGVIVFLNSALHNNLIYLSLTYRLINQLAMSPEQSMCRIMGKRPKKWNFSLIHSWPDGQTYHH